MYVKSTGDHIDYYKTKNRLFEENGIYYLGDYNNEDLWKEEVISDLIQYHNENGHFYASGYRGGIYLCDGTNTHLFKGFRQIQIRFDLPTTEIKARLISDESVELELCPVNEMYWRSRDDNNDYKHRYTGRDIFEEWESEDDFISLDELFEKGVLETSFDRMRLMYFEYTYSEEHKRLINNHKFIKGKFCFRKERVEKWKSKSTRD